MNAIQDLATLYSVLKSVTGSSGQVFKTIFLEFKFVMITMSQLINLYYIVERLTNTLKILQFTFSPQNWHTRVIFIETVPPYRPPAVLWAL